MPTYIPSSGVDETEATLIRDDALQDTDGAEYRVGQAGLFVARGRDHVGGLGSVTGKALYEAGFDSSAGYVIAQAGNSIHAAVIGASLSFSVIDNLPTGSTQMVGCHYANRQYLATGVANRKLELTASGITAIPIGMSASTLTVGVSVTQGAGSISATIGMEYWVTEYDSSRGIESITGSTANTGTFSSLDSVIVTVTGTTSNPRADKLRWYKSVDGGVFPDGGLIQTTAIGTTQITDSSTVTATLTVPLYGIVSIGGLDTNRDEAPPAFHTIFGPYQDSLLAISDSDPRVIRFTPAGYPDSWPSAYGVPLETSRQDQALGGVVLSGRIGIFTKDSVHVIYRLPRDSDSIFAAGEAQDVLTMARGGISRRGHTVFTPPGSGPLAAWVSRDGIWASNLASSPIPLTDKIDWQGRVTISALPSCRLLDDPLNRRLVFLYTRTIDTTYATGVWYLDYQQFQTLGIRVTFADHGPLADAVTIAASDGLRRVVSIDSRANNGQVYIEAGQDADDSHFRDSSGSVRFRMRTKEFLPAGARGTASLGKATWMHDAGPSRMEHRWYFNRRDSNPEIKHLPESTKRTASDVTLNRTVNSTSLEIESSGTTSYGVHWVDIEILDAEPLGGLKGA